MFAGPAVGMSGKRVDARAAKHRTPIRCEPRSSATAGGPAATPHSARQPANHPGRER